MLATPIMNNVEQMLLPSIMVKNGVLKGCNTVFSERFGYQAQMLNGYQLKDLLTFDSADAQSYSTIEWLVQHIDKPQQGLLKNRHYYELPVEVVCQRSNVDELCYDVFFRVLEDKSLDSVTGLPNGWAMSSRANHLLTLPTKKAPQLAVIIFRVDNFSTLNFRQGYNVGDEYLETLGKKLVALFGDDYLVVRFSNAKFGILVEDYQRASKIDFETLVTNKCQAICDITKQPMQLSDNVKVHKSFSVGVSELTAKYSSYFAMEIATETAMHQAAKFSNSKFIFATSELTNKLLMRKLIIDDFPQAIAKQQITQHYQPQYCLTSKKLMGLEALSRWHHKELSHISPAFFASIAEDIGLNFEFDLYVLKQVCQQVKTWLDDGFNVPRVSVNVSFKTLEMPDFVKRVTQIIEASTCPADLIEIEVTETTSINNINNLINHVRQVKALGIHIAIDDFGVGYSSLSLIRRLHNVIDKLKLDKSLIDNLCHTEIDQEFIRHIIELGNVLGLDVLAEGIEHQEQQALLQQLGCKFGQGYFFEKPQPSAQIVNYLDNDKQHAVLKQQ